MSTRSAIGFINAVGQFEAIYCHYDGYPKHVGKILVEYHNSIDAAHEITRGADIRNFDHDGTIARYGDGDGSVQTFASVEEALDNGFDYAYVFNTEHQRWVCYGHDSRPLFNVVEYRIPGNKATA